MLDDATCNAAEIPYNWGGTPYLSPTGHYSACAWANPGNLCAVRACAIEAYFLYYQIQMIFGKWREVGGAFTIDLITSQEYKHGDAGFDAGECVTGQGIAPGQKQCCGTYPTRFAYKDHDGRRGCCGGKTFNSEVMSCCAGDQIKTACF